MSGEERYKDIINLPPKQSSVYPHMPADRRAAQFSPFAALRGFGEMIAEAETVREAPPERDECADAEIDEALRDIRERIAEKPWVRVKFFRADERGGTYFSCEGAVKKLDGERGKLIFEGGETVLFAELCGIEVVM